MKIVKSVSVKRESMADILNSASVNGGCLANILISFSVNGGSLANFSAAGTWKIFWTLLLKRDRAGELFFIEEGEPSWYSELCFNEAGGGLTNILFSVSVKRGNLSKILNSALV